jgi:hypothetical protein
LRAFWVSGFLSFLRCPSERSEESPHPANHPHGLRVTSTSKRSCSCSGEHVWPISARIWRMWEPGNARYMRVRSRFNPCIFKFLPGNIGGRYPPRNLIPASPREKDS